MNILIRSFCTFCCLILFSFAPSYASHVYSSELTYRHVSDSTYKVSLSLYIDCVYGAAGLYEAMPTDTIAICVYDDHTLADTFWLKIEGADTGTDMPNPCGQPDATQCRSITSIIPGVRRFTYAGMYTLPHRSANWRFICGGDLVEGSPLLGRSGNITNLSSGGQLIQLEAGLNSLYNNSNPVLSNFMPSYFCINNNGAYNPDAIDPNGDNLIFNLVAPVYPALDFHPNVDSPVAIDFKSPYTATAPLAVAACTFSFSTTTGAMSFVPSQFQRSLVVYKIEERRGGVLIGTSQHEMMVLTASCADPCNVDSAATIFPVPASDKINISVPTLLYNKVSVRNILGQFIWEQSITDRLTQLNVSRLPAGVYFLVLEGKTANRVQKVVISR